MRWRRRLRAILGTGVLLAVGEAVPAYAQQDFGRSLNESPPVFGGYTELLRRDWSAFDAAPSQTPRLQFFRMPSAAIATPLGLQPEEQAPADDGKSPVVDDDLSFVQFTYGAHIPYLDMYRKGDPGGFGFYKVHSQVQIFDVGATNISAVLQAVTPMGLQNGGINNGATVVSPSLACFQGLGDRTALHAFVGQDLNTSARMRDLSQSNFRCGLALQQAISVSPASGEQGLFLFVQALGQYQTENYRVDPKSGAWDVIPGVQYRVNNACWMSLGISRYSFLSCTWQF